jgi:hypothetical protein
MPFLHVLVHILRRLRFELMLLEGQFSGHSVISLQVSRVAHVTKGQKYSRSKVLRFAAWCSTDAVVVSSGVESV